MLTAGGWLTRKGARQRNKPQVNKHSKKAPPKKENWWRTELILKSEDSMQT
jgi:hypothetical protein